MKKQKMTYLSSGIVGLAGLALMGIQANEAQAATTGTVNYADGATTIWTSPEVGQKPTRYLTNNQNVTIKNTKQVYGQTWYQLADNEWVAGEFVKTGATTPAATTAAPAAKDTITVNYKSGATTIWTNTTAAQPTGAYLTYGKTQNVIASKTANGVTWYQLENKGWVPSSYVVLNNPSLAGATPITDAPAVTPLATTTATTTPAASTTTTTPAATTATSESAAQTSTTQPAPAASQSSTTPTAPAQQQSSVATSTSTSQATQVQTQTQTSQTSTSVAPVAQSASTQQSAPAQQQSSTQQQTQTQNTTNTASSSNTTATTPTQTPKAPAQTSSNAQTVINAALSQIGTPYVWGGSTPGVSLDCSGLVQYAYSRAGVSLRHITTDQEGAGQRVSLNSLQPGDIIFWGGAGASYHDAIYIGGGQYVHAPQPGESVKIGTISSYFMPSFAVRVF
ncbi:C40 family peptidase [Latilactobacillus sakei]|uniref:C40 family peptidase n=2 Tax=Bacteria TaxID=2 RepID=UPI000B9D77B8|nr:C40 family peptidase [Latilactobacillus sakei]MDN4010638.1 NlpC/P60 family protein [Latilactobacillus sakei]BAX69196.1 cell surface protein [Latilactobacillus sakei]